MYSVVLMAALTTGGSAPEFFWGHGCHGCHGCYSCGCHYAGCGCGCACYHWGCGCGCYHWGCGCGVYGGNYCTYCAGCNSCYMCYGCHCYGSFISWTCHGCYCGYSCYAAPVYGAPVGPVDPLAPVAPAPAVGPQAAPPIGEPQPKLEPKAPLPTEPNLDPKKSLPKVEQKGISADNSARLEVQLPADAKLFVDGQRTTSTSERRKFRTPDLQPDQVYFYDLRVELERNGQTLTQTRRVTLRAGESLQEAFNLQAPATATAQTNR